MKGIVTIRNTSGTRVNVLGSYLDLTAETLTDSHLDHNVFSVFARIADKDGSTHSDRYAEIESQELVSHGRLLPEGTYFEPGEIVTVPIMSSIPKKRYDRVRVAAGLMIARGRVLAIENADPKPQENDNGVVVNTKVPEAGLLRKLTRGNRYVRAEYPSNVGGLMALSVLEYELADLVRQDRTDREIADTISEKGYMPLTTQEVEHHLHKAMAKLGVAKRVEIPEALERARSGYRVQFAPDEQSDPPPRPDERRKRFDERLRRFYGYGHVSTTDVIAMRREG